MHQKKIAKSFDCDRLLTQEVLGSKRKTYLLYTTAQGVRRPSALQCNIPEASRRVLNGQLNELEQHGLAGKTIDPQLPPKVEIFSRGFRALALTRHRRGDPVGK